MMVMASTQTLSHCSLHRSAPIFRLPSFKPGGFWKILTEAFCTFVRWAGNATGLGKNRSSFMNEVLTESNNATIGRAALLLARK